MGAGTCPPRRHPPSGVLRMGTVATVAWLGKTQYDVTEARAALARAITARAQTVRKAHDEGMTIYAIAKHLGLTQGAVRRMLGL